MSEDVKTPLQESKQDKVNELTGKNPEPEKKKPGVQKGVKRGPYNKGKKITSTPEPEPEYTEAMADEDTLFLTALINEFRTGAGITPMNPMHQQILQTSTKQMFLKYGASTARWMPEVMFGGSIMFVLTDTFKQLRAKKLEEAQAQSPEPVRNVKKDGPGKENESVEPATMKKGKVEPTKPL